MLTRLVTMFSVTRLDNMLMFQCIRTNPGSVFSRQDTKHRFQQNRYRAIIVTNLSISTLKNARNFFYILNL